MDQLLLEEVGTDILPPSIELSIVDDIYIESVDEEMQKWQDVRGEKFAGIISMHNEHCSYNTLCPFGCSDSVPHCGGVPFDLFLHRYLSYGLDAASVGRSLHPLLCIDAEWVAVSSTTSYEVPWTIFLTLSAIVIA